MKQNRRIEVIIPCLNEEQAIAKVIAKIPQWVDQIIVADNGSTDRTCQIAKQAGAKVVIEPQKGYGATCLRALKEVSEGAIIVFIDGDYSDYPEDMADLVNPILDKQAQMVIGSRILGKCAKGALTIQQKFGNWLACRLMALIWKGRFTDLGPFRAIEYDALQRIQMEDQDYGWTVEMQIKALLYNISYREVPVRYKKRIGISKVSGTIKGTVLAGIKILSLIAKNALWPSKKSL